MAIFGSKLAPQAASAQSVPLPTTLGGVTVTVAGRAAALLFVSPGQINALIPFEVSASAAAAVVVRTEEGTSSYNIWLEAKAPALFTANSSGSGMPLIFNAATWQPAPTIDTTEPVILLATGLGQTTPPGSSTAGGSPTPPFGEIDKTQLTVDIGETPAEVQWAGLMPGFPGIYQINARAQGAASTRIYLQQGTARSNVTEARISSGANVENVVGSIGPLVPPEYSSHQSGPARFSLTFQGVAMSVAFDILPDAKPFLVAAVSESASATIRFDPRAATYQGAIPLPTAAARLGDFSFQGVTLYRLIDNSNGTCTPVPGNIIPPSQLAAADYAALRLVMFPDSYDVSAPIETGYLNISGSALPGRRFTLTDAIFGAFMQIPCANPFPTKTDTLKLFVDGKLIASKEVSYSLVHRR